MIVVGSEGESEALQKRKWKKTFLKSYTIQSIPDRPGWHHQCQARDDQHCTKPISERKTSARTSFGIVRILFVLKCKSTSARVSSSAVARALWNEKETSSFRALKILMILFILFFILLILFSESVFQVEIFNGPFPFSVSERRAKYSQLKAILDAKFLGTAVLVGSK